MPFVPDAPAKGRFVPDAPAQEPTAGDLLQQSALSKNPLFPAAEAGAQMVSGMVAKPVSDVAGLIDIPLHAAGISKKEPADVKRAVESAVYEPKSKEGKAIAEYNPLALVGKALQWGGKTLRGAIDPSKTHDTLRGAAGQAVEEAVNQLPAVLGVRGSVPKAIAEKPTPKPVGAGAEKVVNEMQRQRATAESPTRGEVGMSARESAKLELDEATKPMREKAFASPVRVSMNEALAAIERTKSQTNNPHVIKSLDQAKAIIQDGIDKSKPVPSGRMSAAEFRAMQQGGEQGTMPVKMLDETRQAINDILKSEEGGFARKELLGVQEAMMKYAPKEYLEYLTEYAKRASQMEPFKAPGGAMEKVTTDPAVFNSLNAKDKQNLLSKAFNSTTPGRALSELVRDTRHSPEAAQGVREAYTDWLTQADPETKLPTAKGLVTRWEETREAVKSSKLMGEDHVASMDKIMEDVRQAGEGGAVKKAWASTAGFLFGSQAGHPIVGAHMARDLLVGTKGEAKQRALGGAMMKIASTPEGAAALAAPPTPANVEAVRKLLPTDIATMLVTPEAQQAQRKDSQKRGKRLLSMQPAGF